MLFANNIPSREASHDDDFIYITRAQRLVRLNGRPVPLEHGTAGITCRQPGGVPCTLVCGLVDVACRWVMSVALIPWAGLLMGIG
jgi:hypothetical protein